MGKKQNERVIACLSPLVFGCVCGDRGHAKVYVVDQHESLQRGEELPLNITLAHYVSNATAAPGVLVIEPSTCVISKSGRLGGGCGMSQVVLLIAYYQSVSMGRWRLCRGIGVYGVLVWMFVV